MSITAITAMFMKSPTIEMMGRTMLKNWSSLELSRSTIVELLLTDDIVGVSFSDKKRFEDFWNYVLSLMFGISCSARLNGYGF